MDWTRGHTIGHGSTATVSVATAIQSGDVFAVKSVELSQSEFLRREQKILSSIVSPFIVSYKGCDITRKHSKVMYNLFLEYMPDGSLRNAIHAHGGGRLGESLIRVFTCQILQGVPRLLISGVQSVWSNQGPIAGTPMFMAPEVARGEEQGLASDIWALGCTIIEMASGGAPWHNVSDPVSIIYRVGYSGHLPEFPCCLSEQARDFLDKCLRRDPKERWTASQLLAHPFLVGEFNKQVQESNSSSTSPTSILDQTFWNSLDEPESLESVVSAPSSSSESSAGERIRALSLLSGPPDWDCDDQNWIAAREYSSEEGDTVLDGIEYKDYKVSW
ncbi:hypothetical protein OIU78_015051 [Salix suchowensis]|nr:hypothetical protein OIU78_015051 [Salix suchowensis]